MKATSPWLQLTLLAVTVAVLGVGQANAANQRVCTRDDEKRALDEADSLKDWNEVYRSFKRFAQCDDGAIAEGYGDTVGRLLVTDWQHVNVLYELTVSDSSFKRFVLRHIDGSLDQDVLKTIAVNARQRCPSGRTAFCTLIAAKVKNAD
jgi:hypothetical protein